MTQAARRLTFNEYVNLEDFDDLPEGRCEFIDGELVELPPESGLNDAIANYLFLLLVYAGFLPDLTRPHTCEVEVPILKPKDPQTRYPDLVLLREEHLRLTERRLTITLDMPPPQLVVEVVSPGQTNKDRDYKRKREQYAKCGIPEYWLINPEQQVVTVLELEAEKYIEVGTFRGDERINSRTLQNFKVTAGQLFARTIPPR